MSKLKLTLLLIIVVGLANSYDTVNSHQHIMAYYQQYSFYPIIHVYYNRHFSKSPQFNDFMDVIQQVQFQTSHYAKILFTDCEVQKSDQNHPCKQIKRLNQNRMIIGYIPSSQFTNFGNKIMQSPPQNKMFDHWSDTYTAEQIVRYINQLIPNFYKSLNNVAELQQFLKPKYSPKLFFAAKQGQIPQVIKQIGVQYFLRFDMAYVQDLTQSVINQLQITQFPSLMVLKYNYQLKLFQSFQYQQNDFTQFDYHKIQTFLNKYALKQKRNDYVFHFINHPKQAEILTVDNQYDLEHTLDKIYGWTFVEEGPTNEKLVQMKEKYGLFYDYVHYLKKQVTSDESNKVKVKTVQQSQGQSQQSKAQQQKSLTKLFLHNPKAEVKYLYDQSLLKYRTLSASQFQSNSTIWLKKDYVVVGVRQKYAHLCTIVNKALFDGLTICFIIAQDSYEKLAQSMSVQFQIGFVVSSKKQSNRVQGSQIKSLKFEQVYRTVQYATRMKVKQIIDDFVADPVKEITQSSTIQQLCLQPYKKCMFYFYFYNKQKQTDRTKRQYLQLQAHQFINQYRFYQVDLSCNSHLLQEIPQLKGNNENKKQGMSGLIAYYPSKNQYVYLKAKMTRNVIKKFMKINNEDKKQLPFKGFVSEKVNLLACNSDKAKIVKQNVENQNEKKINNEQNKNEGEQFAKQL